MRRQAFRSAVLTTLALLGAFGLVVLEPEWFAGLLGPTTIGHVGEHFREHRHRVHDLTFAYLLGTAGIGLLSQLRAPANNVGGQLMALVPFAALGFTVALTDLRVLSIPWVAVGSFTLVTAILHPTGVDLLRALRAPRIDRVLLSISAVAGVPLAALAVANIGLQRMTVPDEHALLGHYGFVAASALTVIGLSVLASLRPPGWRLVAWVTGLLAVLIGLTSMLFPEVASSLDPFWARGAISWGVIFVGVAERDRRKGLAGEAIPQAERSVASAGPSRRALVTGSLLVIVVLLFVFLHLTGVGPGLHTPPTG